VLGPPANICQGFTTKNRVSGLTSHLKVKCTLMSFTTGCLPILSLERSRFWRDIFQELELALRLDVGIFGEGFKLGRVFRHLGNLPLPDGDESGRIKEDRLSVGHQRSAEVSFLIDFIVAFNSIPRPEVSGRIKEDRLSVGHHWSGEVSFLFDFIVEFNSIPSQEVYLRRE